MAPIESSNNNQNMDTLWGTHSLWINLVIDPQNLNDEFIRNHSESEIFDLMVYLIHNGITIQVSIVSLHGSTNADDIQKRNIEMKKLYTIKFLLFKLLSHFRWLLPTIHTNLPSVHQEFCFTEFKKFCEQEINVPEDWRMFADLIYHRWIVYFEQKSTYPTKNSSKSNNLATNPTNLDPYTVPAEMQENMLKKVQTTCHYSVNEIEKYIKQLEYNNFIQINVPTFDCFMVDNNDQEKNFRFFNHQNVTIMDKNKFLDIIYYELAIWNYIHEDYVKANDYFTRIKDKSSQENCHDYLHITSCMTMKKYRINDEKINETLEKRLTKFLTFYVKQNFNENHIFLENFDYHNNDPKKMAQILKNFHQTCKNNREEMQQLKRLSIYLNFKCKGLLENLDANFRDTILNADQKQDSKEKLDNEFIEEGEIHDEDVGVQMENDPELCMLQATDPEIILGLIPSIQRIPSLINNRWNLNKFEPILANYNTTLSQADLRKIHIILAKANELRQAKYFHESRVLYLSLLEDIQASQPILAETIRYELLQTDLERFFSVDHKTKTKSTSQHRDLEGKCIEFCRYIDKQKFVYFTELSELVCLFLIEYNYSNSMLEMINHPVDIIRFASLLCHLTINSDSRDNKAKEFWDFCLGSFILPTSKYANNFPRINFAISLADFICKLKNNTIAINMISASLIKLYCTIKEHSIQQIMSICPKFYDLFPSSMSTNLINSIDGQLLNITIDQTFRTYIRVLPQEMPIARYYAEFLMNENQYTQALKHFIEIIMYQTNYFTCFDNNGINESIIHQMIICSKKLDHHILAGILYQLMANPDYGHAFKDLSQNNFIDSSDDLYDCIWDVTLLEYLINYHTRRGEDERKQKAIHLISQLDINSNNNINILREAANLRKNKLFTMLAKQYL
ncbi:integrator complex subunit 8-like protein [Dermatophagoides farinae]|uniref:Integrator complex subunit 8-like protein n=1 Tax=Dermatophagoides farinae TaxID=6954 RepID=A0A9D4SHZ3_DERFA|nr:uncharacterized protein LOC124492877 [Dermatophagoides farinae]KAH7642637.1 integrator complex subunit 8-like protein [Dermatophagoides farinae]